MTTIHKIISLKGAYYSKEYQTIKHHKNKLRYLREETVAKQFKAGDSRVEVHIEGQDETIVLDNFADRALILRYLGKAFI